MKKMRSTECEENMKSKATSDLGFVRNYRWVIVGQGGPPPTAGAGFSSIVREGRDLILTRGIRAEDPSLYLEVRKWKSFTVQLFHEKETVRSWEVWSWDRVEDTGFSVLDSAAFDIAEEAVRFVNAKLMQ
jgi:hypothetical protein